MTQAAAHPFVAIAYLLLAYGLMQAISHCHRLMADSRGGLRVWAALSLLAALVLGALHLTRTDGAMLVSLLAFAPAGAERSRPSPG